MKLDPTSTIDFILAYVKKPIECIALYMYYRRAALQMRSTVIYAPIYETAQDLRTTKERIRIIRGFLLQTDIIKLRPPSESPGFNRNCWIEVVGYKDD